MHFLRLPYDIIEAVIEKADQRTLASLCLVSKAILEITRPLLYRSLRIRLDIWGWESMVMSELSWALAKKGDPDAFEARPEEEAAAFALYRIASRQVRLCKAYHDSLNWKVWVKELTLDIGRTNVEDPERAAFLRNGLPNLTKLQVLSQSGPSIVGKFLINNCPRHVGSLDLGNAVVPSEDISELLNHLPSLTALVPPQILPSNLTSIPPSASRLPLLQHLELKYGFRDRVLFSRIAGLAPSFTSLNMTFDSIEAIDLSCLSTLRYLVVRGEMGSLPESGLRLLTSMIQGCENLQRLELNHLEPLISSVSSGKRLEDLRILHKCPSSLASLTLGDLGFSARYLVDFLSSPRFRLRSLTLSRLTLGGKRAAIFGTPHYDFAAEDEIERICADRGTQCTWIGGWNEENRESQAGLSFDMIRKIAIALKTVDL
ncbi:hypothetical protein JCM3766R1_004104 [Sporobolomyces carnicolor]